LRGILFFTEKKYSRGPASDIEGFLPCTTAPKCSLQSLDDQLSVLHNLPPDFVEEIQCTVFAVQGIVNQLLKDNRSQQNSCFDLAEIREMSCDGDRWETRSTAWHVLEALQGSLGVVASPAAAHGLLQALTSCRSLVACCLYKILFSTTDLAEDYWLQLYVELHKKNIFLSLGHGEQMDLAGFIFSRRHNVTCARQAEQLAALLVRFCRQNPAAVVPAGWASLHTLLSLREAVRESGRAGQISPMGSEEARFLLNIELTITEVSLYSGLASKLRRLVSIR
jgi:hypothetical protein